MRVLRSYLVVLLVGSMACGGAKAKAPAPAPTTKPSVVADPVKPTNGWTIEVVDGELSIDGVIRYASTQEPFVHAQVFIENNGVSYPTTTDEAGRFTMKNLPDGRYQVTVFDATLNSETNFATQFTVQRGKTTKLALALDASQGGEVVKLPAPPKVYTTWRDALDHGAVDQATKLGEQELAKAPSSTLHGALAIAKYGNAIEAFHLMLGKNARQPNIKEVRASLVTLVAALDAVQQHLAEAAKDPQFALELCIGCMAADGAMGLPPGALDIERDRAGNELPEGDARRRPTFRFDHGDLAWGRAMVSFQQALVNVTLAYDWDWFESMVLTGKEPVDGTKLTIKLVEPQRIMKASELALAGLAFSDESRKEFLAETDDDREWVPSPKQKNYASPLSVDAKLYKTWEDIIGDVRALVASKTGISLAGVWKLFGEPKGAPSGFIDVGAMLKTPKDIVIEIGALDRIEVEKDPNVASKMTKTFIKELVGNGYKPTMSASRLTERLLLLRKDLEKGAGDALEDKLKYVLWLN
ncbi:MAG: carboxypeptidase-like regulatory domain-containing protein [Kofleriaceae bacterium]|nr:carboxypeptidase-like regulatory domain-containing protein [Kofleriaceae bacterium]